METIKPAKPSSFKFEKLYLDCIDNYGNCFIIYRAELKFHFLRFHYSALLFSDPAGIIIEKSSHKKTGEPVIKDLIIFYNHILHLKGSWKRKIPPPASGNPCHRSELQPVLELPPPNGRKSNNLQQ